MNIDFLPKRIKKAVDRLDYSFLKEIRLRVGYVAKVLYNDKNIRLMDSFNKPLIVLNEDISEIVSNVTQRSMYAYNEQIKRGYINAGQGIRIGISGNCVFERGENITINNISSLNIRIPHHVFGCSNDIISLVWDGQTVSNTIIVSPPARGKTTFLKDLALKLNDIADSSVLIVDERGEFDGVNGENIDRICFSTKSYAFEYGIRSLSPKIIITDELSCKDDWDCVAWACACGVSIIASTHASSYEDVIRKPFYTKNVFRNVIILREKENYGVLETILV